MAKINLKNILQHRNSVLTRLISIIVSLFFSLCWGCNFPEFTVIIPKTRSLPSGRSENKIGVQKASGGKKAIRVRLIYVDKTTSQLIKRSSYSNLDE